MITVARTRLGMQCRRNGCGAPAPIVTGQRHLLQAESVGEIDQILAYRGLLGHAGSRRIAESCGTVTAQIRHQHTVSGFRERRRYVIKCVDVVGKTVQQEDRKALRIAALFVGNVENWVSESDRDMNCALSYGRDGPLQEGSAFHLCGFSIGCRKKLLGRAR